MSSEHRPLTMRANRLLGAALVENNLIKVEDLEAANERLLELVTQEQTKQASILAVLAWERKAVREEAVVQHVVEEHGLGLVDLRHYEVPDEIRQNVDIGACWATWTVPFDKEEDFHFVATAYYLSNAARAHWERVLNGPILWFATNLEGLTEFLEKLQEERKKAPLPALAKAV